MPRDLSKQTDPQLLAACLDGEAAAWEALLLRYQRLIYSIPIKMGLSSNDAADVFQSVCLKLLENISSLRNPDRLCSWLVITTRRQCWRVAALKRREHLASIADSSNAPGDMPDVASSAPLMDEQQEALELQHILRTAVLELPDRCRTMITLLFYGDDKLSYAEIARIVGIPRDSMGPTRARCLAKLKKLLDGKI